MPALEQNLSDHHGLTPEECIRTNNEPSDRLAVVIMNRKQDETIQRIATAEAIANSRFQAFLRHKNASGFGIYISRNALDERAESRAKLDVKDIRHVHLSLDKCH